MKIVTDSNRIALPLMVSLGLAFAVNVGALVLAHIDILSFLTCPVAAIVSAHHLLRKSAS
jgi:hypothetical protein